MRNKPLVVVLSFLFLMSGQSQADWQLQWQKELPGAIVGNVVSIENQMIVASGNTISAFTKDGHEVWKAVLQGDVRSTVATDEKGIYVNSDTGLYHLNKNGEVQWHFATQDGFRQIPGTSWGWGDEMFDDVWALYRSSPVVDETHVYFGNRNGAFAVDKKTGKLHWHQNQVATVHTTPVIFENKVIVADWDNKLTALEQKSGDILWQFDAKLPGGRWGDWYGWVGLHLNPLLVDNNILVGSRGTYFYNINAATGKENWSWKHPSSWIGSAAISVEGQAYFAMSDGMTIHGMDIRTGNQTLLYHAGFSAFATPARFDNMLLVGTMSGKLHAIDLDTRQGNVLYRTFACQRHCRQYVLESGGLNYAAIKPDNTAAGMTKVVATMLKQLNSILSVTVVGEMVILGTANGDLIVLSKANK